LSIVGIGEDGVAGLTDSARDLIRSAQRVFGGARHLSLAASLIRGATQAWSNPLDDSIAQIVAERGRRVCVLASGDPFQHGIGSVLVRHVPPDEIVAIPAPSAFSLATSRLCWPLQQTTLLSLCGHPLDLIRPHLHPGARILALTSGAEAPAKIANLLCSAGFGTSRLTVLEALGGPRERIRSTQATGFSLPDLAALNTVAIEVIPEVTARILPRAPGLADSLFEHDGQITKREIRALTLSALAPRRGEHLWDVGAGSGSVGIEWMLADSSVTAVAIERRADRAARIRRNAAALGVPNLQVIEGDAPETLQGLSPPDTVFIGGGATTPGVIEAAQLVLPINGRLVINAVTLETEAVVLEKYARHGGALLRIDLQRAGPINSTGNGPAIWHPAKPITQWTWIKQ
jgi:precorrin-6Y C5,15-methyltransferase (decarboxylating)